nr:protein kinase C binding protein 1 [Hymenolepis microstoma]
MQWFSALNLFSPVSKRGTRTPTHALNFKNRTSTPNVKTSSSITNNQCTSPPPKRSRPNFNVEASLISQSNQTDWLDCRNTPASAPPFSSLLPSIKIRRPSDSSDECVKKFCWICQERRPGQELKPCSDCPRTYHQKCLESSEIEKINIDWEEGWRCLLCHEVATCDKEDFKTNLIKWKASIPKTVYEKQIKKILCFMVDYMSIQNWSEPFRDPPDVGDTFAVRMSVRHPMDLRTLYQQVNDGHCKSLKSFLSDFRWIVLNCIPPRDEPEIGLLSKAKLLEQICLNEVALLRACPTCYINRINHISSLPSTSFVFSPISRCDPHIYGRSMMKTIPPEPLQSSWFCKICPVLHPIVWVQYEDGKRWPAKLMAELPNSQLLVCFFGTYVIRKAPTKCVSLYTCPDISLNASANDSMLGGFGIRRLVNAGESKDEGTFNRAVKQLGRHIDLLYQAFPKFIFPSAPATHVLPFSHQSLVKYYKSLYLWAPVSENQELLSNSEPEAQDVGQSSTVTSTGISNVAPSILSPGPNGDDADSAPTVEQPCPPSSPSLPPSLISVTPPLSHSPKTATCTTITTTTTTTVSGNHNTEDLVEPLLLRLSNNFATSFQVPTTGVTTTGRPLLPSTVAVSTSENGRSAQPPLPKETHSNVEVPHREVNTNAVMSVDHQITDEPAYTPYTEAFPASSESTVSTLPLRLSESLCQSDLRSNLVSHFQEARESFSRNLQSLLDGFFQNLEETVNDAAVSSSRGPSAAASEPDLTLPPRPPFSISDQSTQTPHRVVVSTRFLQSNRLEKTLLRAEVLRLTQELERARLEKEYTRFELASNHRDHLSELRAVWEAETHAIVDGIVEICCQDANKAIQEVKKKQWKLGDWLKVTTVMISTRLAKAVNIVAGRNPINLGDSGLDLKKLTKAKLCFFSSHP